MMVKVIFYHFFYPFLNFVIIINYINIYKYIKKTNYETKEKQQSY